tara:strand:+ start:199 stop:747 length:549 start_codon:yes stop_codon:yes gene_type:complete
MAIGTGAFGFGASSEEAGEQYFGSADYSAALGQNYSNIQIFDWINSNFSKLSPGKRNQPGGGGLYDQIQMRAREEQSVIDANRRRQSEIARQEQMQRQAEAAQAERLRQMEIGARTQAANVARSGLQSALEIKSQSKSSRTAGTQGFRRRKLQVNPATYGSVAAGAAANTASQTKSSGVLNV